MGCFVIIAAAFCRCIFIESEFDIDVIDICCRALIIEFQGLSFGGFELLRGIDGADFGVFRARWNGSPDIDGNADIGGSPADILDTEIKWNGHFTISRGGDFGNLEVGEISCSGLDIESEVIQVLRGPVILDFDGDSAVVGNIGDAVCMLIVNLACIDPVTVGA